MDRQYYDIDDVEIRAGVVAHLIRLGKRPPLGQTVGFAAQTKVVQSEADIGNPSKVISEGERIWCQFTITRGDIDRAHKLIDDQTITYGEPKTSKMKFDWRRGRRI
jgi:hypothetical protein